MTKRRSLQHGLTTMNFTRPKSKLRKRKNKEKARQNKLKWMKESGLIK